MPPTTVRVERCRKRRRAAALHDAIARSGVPKCAKRPGVRQPPGALHEMQTASKMPTTRCRRDAGAPRIPPPNSRSFVAPHFASANVNTQASISWRAWEANSRKTRPSKTKITKRTHLGDFVFIITTIPYDKFVSSQTEKRTHFNRNHAFENGDCAPGRVHSPGLTNSRKIVTDNSPNHVKNKPLRKGYRRKTEVNRSTTKNYEPIRT
jgi:hypothetical protein